MAGTIYYANANNIENNVFVDSYNLFIVIGAMLLPQIVKKRE